MSEKSTFYCPKLDKQVDILECLRNKNDDCWKLKNAFDCIILRKAIEVKALEMELMKE